MKFFLKKELGKRVMSMALAVVMLFTMFAAQLPSGLLEVQAAESDINITVHFDNSQYNWGAPAIQFWGGNITPSGYEAGPTEISGWGGATGYTLTNENNGWYSVTLTGSCDGFQFLDMSNPSGNTSGKGYSAYMTQYTDAIAKDLYFKPYENEYNGKWYTDAECTTELAAPADAVTYDVTLHWQNTDNWENVYCHAWNGAGLNTTWPGNAAIANSEKDGWYDVTFEDLASDTFNFIFNNGNGTQTGNQEGHKLAEGANEIWVTGGYSNPVVTTTAPEAWTNPSSTPEEPEQPETTTYEVTLHWENADNWDTIACHAWNGAELGTSWPGVATTANEKNTNWVDVSFTELSKAEFNFIFNNNGNGAQTADLKTTLTEGKNEIWVSGGKDNVKTSTTAPHGWVYADGSVKVVSPQIDGTKVSLYYYAPDAEAVYVAGTMNGWSTTATPMTKGDNGIWSYTATFVAGTYQYKFVVGENGWTNDPNNTNEKIDGNNTFAVVEDTTDDVEATSNYYVTDKMEVQIGETTYPMSVFANGVYETTVDLAAGTYTATLLTNGEANSNVASLEITASEATTYSIHLDNDGLRAEVYEEGETPEATMTVSLIGTVRGLGGDDWSAGLEGYEFTPISDTLYRYEITLDEGTHAYKAVFNYSTWYEKEGSGNRNIVLTEDDVHVVILYDAESGYLYDTVNNEAKVASLLSMKVRPAEMDVIENANGTVRFVAVAEEGDSVTLYYGDKAEVEEKGTAALTEVKMGAVANNRSASEDLWLGDAALDMVYYYDINGERALDGSNPTVTVGEAEYSNYTREAYAGRVVNVPGTFPGPSWDAASNQMTYTGNRTYAYTFENVPAAKYEFKIAINGSWAENYGVGGTFEGGNIKVSVPETQDVTIYYSDVTHNTVNSIDYVFADITVEGLPEDFGTPTLTDDGLTGIYSATITLPAGTYSNLVITCNINGQRAVVRYEVPEFTLTEEKAVTFCMDPVTGLFYHNASDEKINPDKIFFDSKDEAYKSVFGAIATGEEVAFTLATGTDIASASLIIKGNENKSVAMEKVGEATDGVQKWTATVSLSVIGEYTYYFAVSNGASVQVYGDDDGYYGTGTVAELTDVLPYDLVVYQAGFETPDWMKDAVIYQIFPDRFYDGDASNNDAQTTARGEVDYEYISDWYTLPENPEQEALLDEETYKATGAHYGDGQWSNEIYGGDLEGITEKIDYLKALGVTVIYLNPVFSSISSHRYDACDYTKIDPVLGTEGDFTELVEIAEANGMKVVLDGVFNHVSDDSIYFDRYYKFLGESEKIGAYPYWAYVYDYMTENSATQEVAETAAKEYFTAEYGITDYSYTEWFDVFTTTLKDDAGNAVSDSIGLRVGKPVYGYDGWWGYDSMPIIKSTNGSEYQTGDWAEEIIYNAEGTSVTQYWISEGMDGWRLDVANEVSDETWQRFRESVKGLDSEAVIIGEIWDDATKYILGDMYDSVMNYMFRNAVTSFAMGTDAATTTKNMEKLRERYPEEAFYAMMNLVGSHDTSRILSYLDGVGDDRSDKSLAAAFPTYENTSWDAKQRQYLVAFLQFTYAGAPTIYYGDEIGMVGADDPDDRRAFEWGKGNKELVTYYATLGTIRNSYEVLRTGSVEVFDAGNSNVLAYVRRDSKDAMVVLANNSASEVNVTLDLTELNVTADVLKDLLDSETSYTVVDGKATVTIPARRGVILTDDNAVKAIAVNTEALKSVYEEQYIVTEENRPVDKEPSTPVVPVKPVKPSVPSVPSWPSVDEEEVEEVVATVKPIVNQIISVLESIFGPIEIAEEETPLASGEEPLTEEQEVVEEVLADSVEEIEEEKVPLAAEESNNITIVAVLVATFAFASFTGVYVYAKQRKLIK